MTQLKRLLSLLTATLLLASSVAVLTSTKVNAFDPGGPPVGGASPSVPTGNWEYVNYDPNGGGYSPQKQITKDNVQYLETKWVYPYTRPSADAKLAPAYGSGAPVIVVDGVAYIAFNDRRVIAVDVSTGKLIWASKGMSTLDINTELAPYPFLQLVFPGIAVSLSHVHALNYYRAQGWLISSSIGSCFLYALDAKTGEVVWKLGPEQVCGTTAELGDPSKGIIGTLGNQGYYSSLATHPPQFLGNIMFYPISGASGAGGRSMITAFDMSDPKNPKRLYREPAAPPAQGDPDWAINECKKVNGNGWYFEYPKYLESVNYPARDKAPTYLATKCTDVDPEAIKNDGMDLVPGSKTFGKAHTASQHGSAVWGNSPIDQETGIVYLAWGDQGPYTNVTHKYGPGLHGSGFVAFDVKTGKMVWWYQAVVRDLWDYDCSWNGILGQVQGKKAYIKGCKNGIVYALDAATGQPYWVQDFPSTIRGGNNIETYYGVGKNNSPKDPEACCRLTKQDMGKPWMNYPKGLGKSDPFVINCYTTCLESDIAYDGKRVYVATFNSMNTHKVGNVFPFFNNGVAGGPRTQFPNQKYVIDTTINAVDAATGKIVWSTTYNGTTFRGGVMVTGGMVLAYGNDGNLKFFDADNGKLIHERFFGIPVSVMPTVGATKDGQYRIFMHVGGGGGLGASALPIEGTLMAFGLPDKLPQPQVITKEVIKEVPKEVIKEVIKEVPGKEVIKEVTKEVIKEVPREVIKTVTVESISPISYAAIGIGVVLVVISGVLFSRRKKA